MSNGRPVDVHWTGGLDRTVGQAWSVRVGCPMDVPWTSIGGQDSGTSLVSEGGMSNGRPVDVHWTGGLDRTVGQAWSVRVGCPMDVPWTSIGQAWSVRVGCPMDVPWMSIGQVDWTGQWDKPGQ